MVIGDDDEIEENAVCRLIDRLSAGDDLIILNYSIWDGESAASVSLCVCAMFYT